MSAETTIKTKTLFFLDHCDCLGGAQISLTLLVSALRSKGYDLQYIHPRENRLFPLDTRGKNAFPFAALLNAVFLLWMYVLLRPKLIYCNSLRDRVTAAFLPPSRVVSHLRDVPKPIHGILLRLVSSNQYVVSSRFMEAALRERGVKAKISILPNIIHAHSGEVSSKDCGCPNSLPEIGEPDLSVWAENGRPSLSTRSMQSTAWYPFSGSLRETPIDLANASTDGNSVAIEKSPLAEPFRLIMVANLVRWKNHKTAIEAVDELNRRGIAVTLSIYGADVLNENADYVAELHLLLSGREKNILLIQNKRIEQHDYRQYDCLVHPTWNEPFGRVIAESLAAGVPVVVTDSGGPAELVKQYGGGVIVRNSMTFSDGLEEVNRNYQRIKKEAVSASERIREDFSPKAACVAFEDLLRQLK